MKVPSLARLERILISVKRVRLLVVGDLVLDEYVWGDADRISPEAPVAVVKVREETQLLGGAANVVRNAAALGARVDFCAVVGKDAAGRRAAQQLEQLGVDTRGLVEDPGRPTTRKTRVVAAGQQLLRFDREESTPVSSGVGRRLLSAIDAALQRADGVVVADYGKGVLARGIAAAAMRRFRAAELSVAVDPKASVAPWSGAAIFKPNLREAQALSGVAIAGEADLARAAAKLRKRLGGAALVVTRGARGITLFDDDHDGVQVGTVQREVFDVQGAGDTSMAMLCLARWAGASLVEAAVLANAAAGVVVGKIGTATASGDEVRERLPAALAAARGGA